MADEGISMRPHGDEGSASFVQRRQLEGSCNKQRRLSRQLLSNQMSTAPGYLHSCNLVGHFGCVNAIEFSNNDGELLVSGGDDRRVLLWNLERQLSSNPKPGPTACMKGEHNSNIFCLALDVDNRHTFSGGNDDQVLVHDTERLETVDVFTHDDAVYGIANCPTDGQSFATAGADGRLLIWDLRESSRDPFVLANYADPFHAVIYHPLEPRFLVSANAKEGVALWDVRKPRTCLLRYSSAYTELNAMSVRFNMFGTKILALRRRLPPVIYNVHCPGPVIEFDHSGYYNSCTMKSCCFAGDRDQYILSGSDDFNLFLWKVPEPCEEKEKCHISEATLVMSGHRQIVNQVRYNYSKSIIASSGVEKVIKMWSPVKYPGMAEKADNGRQMFTHQQYFDMMINSDAALSHDYTLQSTEEDPHMMAFFDSLIQREVERSISSDSDSSDDDSPTSMFLDFVRNSDSESTESDRGEPQSLSEDSDSSSNEGKTFHTLTKGACIADHSVRSKTRAPQFELRGPSKKGETRSSLPGTSTSAAKRRRGDSSSEDTTASQSSGDMFILKLKNRLFQRISKRKKRPPKDKKREVPGKDRFKKSKPQEESDRLTNLRQREAFCKILRERIPESSDSDSENDEAVDEVLKNLANGFNRRTDVARQRGAALRIKKLKITNDDGNQPQRFEIRNRDQAEAGTSSPPTEHKFEDRLDHNSVNGVSHTGDSDNDDDRQEIPGKGQRSTEEVPPTTASSNLPAGSSGGHFKRMKKGKKKNYRTKGKDYDS